MMIKTHKAMNEKMNEKEKKSPSADQARAGRETARSGRRARRNPSKNGKAARNGKAADGGRVRNDVRPLSDAEVKAASDRRRAARRKQHIRIHPDHIENLDETAARQAREAVEVKETGYKSRLRLTSRGSRLNWLRRLVSRSLSWLYPKERKAWPEVYYRRAEFKRNLLEMRVETRCALFFHDPRKKKMYVQFCPLDYMKRTSVCHIEKHRLSRLRRYAYYADMDMTPEPTYVMLKSGVYPKGGSCRLDYELVEEEGKCTDLGPVRVYRMEPIPGSLRTL